jgi:hypothetical protein
MNITDYTGLSIDEVAERFKDEQHLLYLSGEKREEEVAMIIKEHGERAGAILAAAFLFIENHQPRKAIYEGASLWRQAAKQSKRKKNAEILLKGANDIEEWMSWGGIRDDKSEWPVTLGELNLDEMMSLGNFLIACAIREDKSEGCNSSLIGVMMAAKVLTEVNKSIRCKAKE